MRNYSADAQKNVGVGPGLMISDLAALITRTVGVENRLRFDPSKPGGAPQELLNTKKLHELGWRSLSTPDLEICAIYEWFLQHVATGH